MQFTKRSSTVEEGEFGLQIAADSTTPTAPRAVPSDLGAQTAARSINIDVTAVHRDHVR